MVGSPTMTCAIDPATGVAYVVRAGIREKGRAGRGA